MFRIAKYYFYFFYLVYKKCGKTVAKCGDDTKCYYGFFSSLRHFIFEKIFTFLCAML